MKTIFILATLWMFIPQLIGQNHIGTDRLYFELDQTGIVRLHGPTKRAMFSNPVDHYLQLSDLTFEVYDWLLKHQPQLKGVAYERGGLQIEADVQPDLTLPTQPLSVFTGFLSYCVEGASAEDCNPENLKRTKDDLLQRGMDEADFQILMSSITGKWMREVYAHNHPLSRETSRAYRDLMNHPKASIQEIETFVEFDNLVQYKIIGDEWLMGLMSLLSTRGQRVLLRYVIDEFVHKGSLNFSVWVGVDSERVEKIATFLEYESDNPNCSSKRNSK